MHLSALAGSRTESAVRSVLDAVPAAEEAGTDVTGKNAVVTGVAERRETVMTVAGLREVVMVAAGRREVAAAVNATGKIVTDVNAMRTAATEESAVTVMNATAESVRSAAVNEAGKNMAEDTGRNAGAFGRKRQIVEV